MELGENFAVGEVEATEATTTRADMTKTSYSSAEDDEHNPGHDFDGESRDFDSEDTKKVQVETGVEEDT
ncbi:unnamed protein product, partial [Amoebophrya sp. A25]|eukprot:GSA25T00002248001.1